MLSEILPANPADAFARYGLAMELVRLEQFDRALQEFSTILQTSPDYVPAYQMSAQQLIRLGRTEEARDRLEAGLAACERTGNGHATSEMSAMLDELGG